MLIWRHICFALASLIVQCTYKIINVSQQRCPCICFHEVAIVAICIKSTTITLRPLNFQWLPNFSAFISCFSWYVFGCSQLNWPWYFEQCSVAPAIFLQNKSSYLIVYLRKKTCAKIWRQKSSEATIRGDWILF